MAPSNYDLMKEKMQKEFARRDVTKAVEKFALKSDETYLYLTFFARPYRIHRATGLVQWSEDGFQKQMVDAGYNDSMTIFDLLCNSKDSCCPSGKYNRLNNVKGIVAGAGSPEEGMFPHEIAVFDRNLEKLRKACKHLGGEEYPVGDVAYVLPMFDFLSVIFQFWESDEEFPPTMKLMWDENILDYMHYETAAFAMCHLIERLRELCD